MPHLAFNLTDGNDFVFDLLEARITLGRAGDNAIVINNTYISARHAEFIRLDHGGYEVVDLQSSNSTFLNGEPVARAPLRNGDLLRFGQLAARYQDGPPQVSTGAGEIFKGTGAPAAVQPENGARGDTEIIPLHHTASPMEPTASEPSAPPLPFSSPDRESPPPPPPPGDDAVVENLRRTVSELQAQINSATVERDQLREETRQLSEQKRLLANLESKRDAVAAEFEKLQADVAVATTSLDRVHREVEQTRDSARRDLRELEDKRAELTRQQEQARDQLAALQSQIAEAEKRAADLAGTEERFAAETAVMERELAAAREEARELASQKASLTGFETRIAQLRREEEQARTVVEQLGRERDAAQKRLGDRRAQCEELHRQLHLDRERGRAQHTLLEALGQRRELAESAAAEVEKRRTQSAAEVTELDNRAASLRQEQTALREALETAENKLSALREQTAAAEKAAAESAREAAAKVSQFEQVETRLRAQLVELEEKHETMRQNLPVDEATVVLFANDLIKRLDLIDALRDRFATVEDGEVARQIFTLRASFEDILMQHGVVEFDIAPGTGVDVDLRRRITVVESEPGPGQPRVVESLRSGFLRDTGDGRETIIRKVEVRTSSAAPVPHTV